MMPVMLAFAAMLALAALAFAPLGRRAAWTLPMLAALALGLYGHWGQWHGTAIRQLMGERSRAATAERQAHLERRLLARVEAQVRRRPDDAHYQYLLGAERTRAGMLSQAAASFAAAARLAPQNPAFAARHLESVILANDYQLDAATLAAAEQLLERHPQQVSLMFIIGLAELQAGDRAAAIGWWRRALPHASGDTRAIIEFNIERAGNPPP